jgi:carboxymethylenebutenolidase
VLKAAFAEAHRPASVEVYPANHGWCVRGSPVYDEAQAERAWKVLSDLYKKNLV